MALPDWKNHWRTLISQITLLQTPGALRDQIHTFGNLSQPHVLAFVNAHALNCAAESQAFFESLLAADTLYRDGIGMSILYKMQSTPAGLNLNGTDLIPQLIAHFDGRTIALYGTQEPYLAQACSTITATLAPNSAINTANGFMPAARYAELAAVQQPSIIVLGMGMPKQEQVAVHLRSQLHHPCLIVCGGAIIDFLGGKVVRAPRWMRQCNLEWLYRLALEPKRLFKRYVMGNPKFLMRAAILPAQKM